MKMTFSIADKEHVKNNKKGVSKGQGIPGDSDPAAMPFCATLRSASFHKVSRSQKLTRLEKPLGGGK